MATNDVYQAMSMARTQSPISKREQRFHFHGVRNRAVVEILRLGTGHLVVVETVWKVEVGIPEYGRVDSRPIFVIGF